MDSVASAKIRNVALIGHGGCGKTTLTEALLVATGSLKRAGRVEEGTTASDYEPEEVKRKLSVSLAVAPMLVEGHKINLIDTPGYPDFVAEVEAALSVVDLAILVVSAVEGVEVQSEVTWRLAEALGLPRAVFVNKLDRERADFERTLGQLQDLFGSGIAPVELPIGEEAHFKGVVDLLSDSAIVYVDGAAETAAVPEEMSEMEHRVRQALVEGIVVADDELMERYLEGEVPSTKELEATLAHGIASATVFPVVCGSGLTGVGVDRLATLICEIGPSPLDRPPVRVHAGDAVVELPRDPAGPPLARVFKTIADPFVGRISLVEVLSGTLRPDMTLYDSRNHAEERVHGLQMMRGKETQPVKEAPAGDIVAIAKLNGVLTGDTLAPKGQPVVADHAPVPAAVISIALRPKAKGDEDKLMTALHRLQEEDPALVVHRDDETHQTVLSGVGEMHLQIVCEKLQRKFGVEVEVEPMLVAYRETVTSVAEAEGKYKKQTGGHGQFGVANLRIEPLGRGEGFQFSDEIVGGAIPRQFIPAVEKGVREAMSSGGAFGYPVVDVKVTCFDGKYHAVDSSEMSFKMAAAIGFREAIAKASPVLLEPVSRLEVTIPAAYQGDVLGDLNSRRGRVIGTEPAERGEQTVVAHVPRSEISRYATDLRALTAGRGRFVALYDHHEVVPPQLADRLARPATGA